MRVHAFCSSVSSQIYTVLTTINTCALAALAAVSAASAQSTVTLYGSIDAGYSNKQNSAGGSDTAFGGELTKSNRIGFKGTEDLGGGLKALFVLETGFNSGRETPTSLGDRGAFVGLQGGFGTVTMGSSQLTPSFYAMAATNPTAADNFGLKNYAGASRFDNSVNYMSPTILGGLVLRGAMVQKADNGGNNNANDVSAIYAKGPLTLAASASDNGFDKGTAVGGAYNFGMFEVFAGSTETPNTTTAATSTKYNHIGASVPVNSALVLAADYQTSKVQATNVKVNSTVLSAQYSLSKRTYVSAYTKKAQRIDAEYGISLIHSF